MQMKLDRGRPDVEAPKSRVDPVNIPSLNWWRLCKPQLAEVQCLRRHRLRCKASKIRQPRWPQLTNSLKCQSVWLNLCQPQCWLINYRYKTEIKKYQCCSALLSVAQHCSALLSIAQHCSALLSVAKHCSALISVAQHCSALLSIAQLLLSIAQNCLALLSGDQHCSVVISGDQHCSALISIAQHCSALLSIT